MHVLRLRRRLRRAGLASMFPLRAHKRERRRHLLGLCAKYGDISSFSLSFSLSANLLSLRYFDGAAHVVLYVLCHDSSLPFLDAL